jgi:hypothetical protein
MFAFEWFLATFHPLFLKFYIGSYIFMVATGAAALIMHKHSPGTSSATGWAIVSIACNAIMAFVCIVALFGDGLEPLIPLAISAVIGVIQVHFFKNI